MQIYYNRLLAFLAVFVSLRTLARPPVSDSVLTIYFHHDRYDADQEELAKIDSFFSVNKGATVTAISGFTDTTGSQSYNKLLSSKRSREIFAYLGKKMQLPKGITLLAMGETAPASGSNNAMNRRVEILLQTNASLPVPSASDAPSELADTGRPIVKRITFDNIYFVPDMAMVEFNSLAYIDQLAGMLRAYDEETFEIRGHVNCPLRLSADTAYMKKMDKLSTDRAKEVYDQLVRRGIAPSRLSWLGMSNREMIYPNARSLEEQRRNMRVEVVVRK